VLVARDGKIHDEGTVAGVGADDLSETCLLASWFRSSEFGPTAA
jgi:hypothetical protein